MSSISGEVRFNEARKILPAIRRRLFGMPDWLWRLSIILVPLPLLFGLVYCWDQIYWVNLWVDFCRVVPSGGEWIDALEFRTYRIISNPLFGVVIWFALMFAYIKLIVRLRLRYYRRTLVARGVPLPCPMIVTINKDAFIHESEGVVRTAPWSCVSELFESHGYWVFLVPTTWNIVPRRFFADVEGERAFITEALSYMTDAARARSGQAIHFAKGAGK